MSEKEQKYDKRKELLKYAHDIRKFEIDLLWKRSAFIWTLITIVLSGVIVLLTDPSKKDSNYLSVLLTILGLVLSICWYYLNRGGKYWQEKWESVIMQNEDEVTGPMYKESSQYEIEIAYWKLNSAYGFSPSKILINISLFFVLIWVALLFIQANQFSSLLNNSILEYLGSILITLIITAFSFGVLYKISKNRID